MRRAAGALVVAVVAALTLAGCGGPDAGRVRGKDHDAAHYQPMTQCSTVNKVTSCHSVPYWVPARWRLYLVEGDDRGWVRVDAGTYQTVHMGDYYRRADR